jgi:hypothetical protein
MPDLDQIKQGEQERGTGAGGFPRAGRAIAGRPVRQYLAPLRRCGNFQAPTADSDQVAPLVQIVIASAAKQSRARWGSSARDCFVASGSSQLRGPIWSKSAFKIGGQAR